MTSRIVQTSISAEFSVGSSTSKTMISMATSRSGISMVTTSSITHAGGVENHGLGKKTPDYSITSLRPADPLSSETATFIKSVLQEYTSESFKLYWYCLTHPATLAYMVLLGGLLVQYGISKALALTVPLLTFYLVKARLRAFTKKDPSQYRTDLAHPSRYYNERQRAMFVAAREDDDIAEEELVDYATNTDSCLAKPTSSLVLGTCAVDTEQAGSTAVIRHLCVDQGCRRLGIGQELLTKAIAFCEKERFQRIVLSTNNLQGPAAKLCRKHGFRPVNETVDVTVLPGVDITRTHFVRCLRMRHTSSCCR